MRLLLFMDNLNEYVGKWKRVIKGDKKPLLRTREASIEINEESSSIPKNHYVIAIPSRESQEKEDSFKQKVLQLLTREDKGDEQLKEALTILKRIDANGIRSYENYTSKVEIEKEVNVNSTIKRFLKIASVGYLEQVLIISDSTAFTVRVKMDDETFFDDTYTWLNTYSNYINEMSAFDVSSVYYVSLRNFNFRRNFSVELITTDDVTFTLLYAKYKTLDEIIYE